jgi:hypothetical protein
VFWVVVGRLLVLGSLVMCLFVVTSETLGIYGVSLCGCYLVVLSGVFLELVHSSVGNRLR